ncbi:hypothetical protein MFLAVUS_008119 [Mucor flavus]|uniref:WD40 repeat-like protein n=1 Tax=Mucor flavus TaxID=439312 RepID=A0ABP9Z662_9FUNG
MSFNIPGYFLDQKTKKLFKITPHGPFSLKELKKRLKTEEEEAAAAATATSGTSSKKTGHSLIQSVPNNMTQFLRQRATMGSQNSSLINNAAFHYQSDMSFLMTQLKLRTKVELEGPKQAYDNMLVDMTADPDYGEIIMSHRVGKLSRFGYQVNPGFQVWKAGSSWEIGQNNASSLHCGSYSYILNGLERRTIVGTSGGSLWRHSLPKLPALIDHDLRQQFLSANGSIRDDNSIIGTPVLSYADHTESSLDKLFVKKKDLFWSSTVYDEYDRIAVGGDQALYHLSSNLDPINSRKVKSTIFSTHIPKDQPNVCWTGSRNGLIHFTDFRQKQINMNPEFRQSSSVNKIQSLVGFELLTLGLDGSIDIWDTRKPRNYQHTEQTNLPEPIRKLRGHVNETSHNLGFDIDLKNNLLMASGSDGYVRIWSIFNSNSNKPVWTSEKFPAPIPAAKFIVSQNRFPRVQEGWSSLIEESLLLRQCPGIVLFGVNSENSESSSIQWLTSIK